MLSLLAVSVFTLVVARLVAFKATLGLPVLGRYLLYGVALGLLADHFVVRMFSPYGEHGPWIGFFSGLARLVLIVGPVVWQLFRSNAIRALSVQDAFLAVLLTGFGYDFGILAVNTLAAGQLAEGYAYLPPSTLRGQPGGPVYAGFTYWAALTALGFVGAWRFLRGSYWKWIVGGFLAVWGAFESSAYTTIPEGFWGWLYKMGSQGALTGWITLAVAVGLGLYESSWAKMPAGDLFSYKARVRRQAAIAAAEGDEFGSALQARAEEEPPRGSRVEWVVWAGWAAVAFVFLLLPRLPEGFRVWLWAFWGLHFQIPGLPLTLLNLVLAVIVVRRLIGSPARPLSRARVDDVLELAVEKSILWIAFGLFLAVTFYGRADQLFDAGPYIRGIPGQIAPYYAATILMVLAVAFSGVAVAKNRKWQAVPLEERRKGAVRIALRAGIATGVTWLVSAIYTSQLMKLHELFGDKFYTWLQGDGNYLGAALDILLCALIAGALYLFFDRLARRTEEFLVG